MKGLNHKNPQCRSGFSRDENFAAEAAPIREGTRPRRSGFSRDEKICRSGFSRDKNFAAKAAPTNRDKKVLAKAAPTGKKRDTTIPPRGQKQLRKGRVSLAGAFYFVTVCTKNRRKILNQDNAFRVLLEVLKSLEQEGFWIPYFLVAMPDHVHIVFQLQNRGDLSSVLRRFKGRSSLRLAPLLGRPVWQKGFYDHLIRGDESYEQIIQYAWYNPLRAGLVQNPIDYPYWWSKIPLKEEEA